MTSALSDPHLTNMNMEESSVNSLSSQYLVQSARRRWAIKQHLADAGTCAGTRAGSAVGHEMDGTVSITPERYESAFQPTKSGVSNDDLRRQDQRTTFPSVLPSTREDESEKMVPEAKGTSNPQHECSFWEGFLANMCNGIGRPSSPVDTVTMGTNNTSNEEGPAHEQMDSLKARMENNPLIGNEMMIKTRPQDNSLAQNFIHHDEDVNKSEASLDRCRTRKEQFPSTKENMTEVKSDYVKEPAVGGYHHHYDSSSMLEAARTVGQSLSDQFDDLVKSAFDGGAPETTTTTHNNNSDNQVQTIKKIPLSSRSSIPPGHVVSTSNRRQRHDVDEPRGLNATTMHRSTSQSPRTTPMEKRQTTTNPISPGKASRGKNRAYTGTSQMLSFPEEREFASNRNRRADPRCGMKLPASQVVETRKGRNMRNSQHANSNDSEGRRIFPTTFIESSSKASPWFYEWRESPDADIIALKNRPSGGIRTAKSSSPSGHTTVTTINNNQKKRLFPLRRKQDEEMHFPPPEPRRAKVADQDNTGRIARKKQQSINKSSSHRSEDTEVIRPASSSTTRNSISKAKVKQDSFVFGKWQGERRALRV